MRQFRDFSLGEIMEACERYAKTNEYLLERVEMSWWSEYEVVMFLSRGSKPPKLIPLTKEMLDFNNDSSVV